MTLPNIHNFPYSFPRVTLGVHQYHRVPIFIVSFLTLLQPVVGHSGYAQLSDQYCKVFTKWNEGYISHEFVYVLCARFNSYRLVFFNSCQLFVSLSCFFFNSCIALVLYIYSHPVPALFSFLSILCTRVLFFLWFSSCSCPIAIYSCHVSALFLSCPRPVLVLLLLISSSLFIVLVLFLYLFLSSAFLVLVSQS